MKVEFKKQQKGTNTSTQTEGGSKPAVGAGPCPSSSDSGAPPLQPGEKDESERVRREKQTPVHRLKGTQTQTCRLVQAPPHTSAPCSDVTHHSELGLGLLDQIVLFGLADAGEDARLGVEVQHVALEICEEVAKTANATHSHHTLGGRGREGRNVYPDEDLWCRNKSGGPTCLALQLVCGAVLGTAAGNSFQTNELRIVLH